MRTRPWLVLAALLIPVASAHADDHSADFYAAFAHADGSHLWGLHQSFAVTLPYRTAHDAKLFSVVNDLSAQFGSHDGATVTRVTYLFGPRVTLSKKTLATLPMPHMLHLQLLLGGVHRNDAGNGSNDLAFGLGAAWEVLPAHFGKNRGQDIDHRRWGVRAQFDYVAVKGDRDNFLRVSGGIVYRFTKQ